jgi:hypothetical protein
LSYSRFIAIITCPHAPSEDYISFAFALDPRLAFAVALAFACSPKHPTKIVILSEGGAFAAAVEGPAIALAVALAVAFAFAVALALALVF